MKKIFFLSPFILGLTFMFMLSCKDDKEEPEPEVTVTDVDGNLYHGVKIGTKIWMVENLQVRHYRNGDPIPVVTGTTEWATLTTGACCWYNNDSATYNNPYGRLYNWHAVNDPRGLAPEGWHVASKSEIDKLIESAGGFNEAGGNIKVQGTNYWNEPNTGATNKYGFSAYPGGMRYQDGSFLSLHNLGYWWSSTEIVSTMANHLRLSNGNPYASTFDEAKVCGQAIRCVKD
jgi:uncharacterized protein (TIGR02145 family)